MENRVSAEIEVEARKKEELFRYIKDIIVPLKDGSKQQDVKSPLFFIICADIMFSIPYLEEIIDSHPYISVQDWKLKIEDFLSKRWQRIANSPICYTLNDQHCINWICIKLASFCDPAKRNVLLMPGVQVKDVYLSEINEYEFGQFIISDDKKTFISVDSLVGTAVAKLRVEITKRETSPIYVTTTAIVDGGKERELTPTELSKLGCVHEKIEEIRKTAMSRTGFLNTLFTPWKKVLYRNLVALREGFQEGDASHSGHEMNAGSAANIAMVQFSEYFNGLSERRKVEIRNIHSSTHNLGQILEATVFRDEHLTGQEVNTCLQINGRYLDAILSANQDDLNRELPAEEEQLQSLKERLLHEIKTRKVQLDQATIAQFNQKEFCLDVFRDNFRAKINEKNEIFLKFAEFIFTECIRIRVYNTDGSSNKKRICYVNLLFAMGFESKSFNQRTEADNLLILKEIYTRLKLIAFCNTGRMVKQPTSQKYLEKLLQQNPIISRLLAEVCAIPPHNIKTREYEERYPLVEQRQLISQEIIQRRSLEAERLAKEIAERQQQAERDRLAKEIAERQQAERDRLAKEIAERQQAERDRLAKEIAERQQAERDRLAKEIAERQQAERDRLKRKESEVQDDREQLTLAAERKRADQMYLQVRRLEQRGQMRGVMDNAERSYLLQFHEYTSHGRQFFRAHSCVAMASIVATVAIGVATTSMWYKYSYK